MKIIIRTWHLNRDEQQPVLEVVKIDPSIYDKTSDWARERKDLLLTCKYLQSDSEKNKLRDRLNQDFNSFIKTLPDQYQHNTLEFMAINHLYTLYSDNPEILPDKK